MLEILALIYLCKKMGNLLRAKGWKPLWMQVLVVVGWVGGALVGGLAYGVYVAITHGVEAVENIGMDAYPAGLLGAALAESVVFGTAWLLRDRTPPPEIGFTHPGDAAEQLRFSPSSGKT